VFSVDLYNEPMSEEIYDKKLWVIVAMHPEYGEVQVMGCRDGEPYRMMVKDGVVSLMPLDVLNCDG